MFIVIEGIDGSGKTTLAKALAGAIGGLYTSEPYGLKAPSMRALGATLAELAEAYCEDRRAHVDQVIMPVLSDGGIVVCDRYYPSTLAYQDPKHVDLDVLAPDLTVIIRMPVELALLRIEARTGQVIDWSEREDILLDAAANYAHMHALLPTWRMLRVDGREPAEDLLAQVMSVIDCRCVWREEP